MKHTCFPFCAPAVRPAWGNLLISSGICVGAWILALPECVAAPSASDDILIADFEQDTYGDWQTTGEAFGPGPAHGTLPNQMAVSGFLGKGLVNSYFRGDSTTGSLTSPEFQIRRRYINFLVGGGNHPGETCVNLIVDGAAVISTPGPDSETLDWASWDVGGFQNRAARIQILDRNQGGWGHICADQIVQSRSPMVEPVVTNVLYAETYRPQIHFTPQRNWHNDPNGLVFYAGEYHMFFQHNPTGINWGNMTWGHAISSDLVHWRQLANSLEPDALGTMFSGSAVVDWHNSAGFERGREKTLVAIYTAAGGTSEASKGRPFSQCIAYSNDRGRSWTKFGGNPVLPHVVGENRDPKVVWHAGSSRWVMALYEEGNRYGFYSSPDLKSWTHLQDMEVAGCSECPDFFQIPITGEAGQTRWVWTAANGHYLVGTFDGRQFHAESDPLVSDYGKNFYAVQTYSDLPATDGRRVQIAWMNGGRYPGMPFNQQMSFPCELELRRFPEGLRLCRTPVRELSRLRGGSHSWNDRRLLLGESTVRGSEKDAFEIEAEIEPGGAQEIGLDLRGYPLSYSVADSKLTCLGAVAPCPLENGRLRLRILVDRTSLEVFANGGRVSMTSCFLPKPSNKQWNMYARGGVGRVIALRVNALRSIWH